ncbi:DUF7550 family protein [Halobacterium zhouii]|uniref:DUF7550 family protein n=1 Tax=Halobacterium zhouii TaxID=2902624 RepID=UPI001E38A00F|nr:hypothetical protein [Halobacterium zhouii]
MTADHDDAATEHEASHSDAPGTDHDPDAHEGGERRQRVTSPMQDYTVGNVFTGLAVLVVGAAIAYALPFFV